jgi:hypothetical protein
LVDAEVVMTKDSAAADETEARVSVSVDEEEKAAGIEVSVLSA